MAVSLVAPPERLFEFIFKYPRAVYDNGELVFGAPWPLYVAVLAVGLVAGPALLSYARVAGRSRPRDRAVLGVLRFAAIALLIFCLTRPALLLSTAVPQRNFLGILLDDSRSMTIADESGRPRGDYIRAAFGRDSAIGRALAERFQLRFFRFSGASERVEDPASLSFAGRRSRIMAAIERARDELAQVPLAGLVVVTDGAETGAPSGEAPKAGVPVFTVGVGRERLDRDLEISGVEAPTSTLEGSTVAVDLSITQAGLAGRTVRVVAEEGGRLLAERQVKLGDDASATPVRMLVPAPEPGARMITFRVAPEAGEVVTENNRRDVLVSVRRERQKVLYIEGEPRFELKFLRRAVEQDANLQLVALQRSAEGKFLRLGVDDSLELASGFPRTREELFAYRAVVLGSVEAAFFSLDQLRMLADFVSRRGGGLLFLGGRRAFAEGGYAGTPLAEVMPVVLGAADTTALAELAIRPTSVGLAHPAMQLGGTEEASAARWRTLPPLTAVNAVTRTKPGATVLLTGTSDGSNRIVLAFQRYGRGKAAAFVVQDSWLWQMHADIAVEDQTHETFWKQMLRWLASDVPHRIEAGAAADRGGVGEPLTLTADVRDERFAAVNGSDVVARVTAPSGTVTEVPMAWQGTRDGAYGASFVPYEPGVHEVSVTSRAGAEGAEVATTYVSADEGSDEFVGAGMRAPLLRRLAEETGGRFYTPATAARLAEDIAVSGAGVTVQERKELWDMPLIFVGLFGLLLGEWGYRRARGLA